MRRLALIAAFSFLIGAGTGVAAGYARWHNDNDRFHLLRFALLNRADDAPKGGVLLIGDSVVQRLYLPQLCGLPVFNAGMSGARADQVAPLVEPMVAKLRPRFIILSAGHNDIDQSDPWAEDVEAIAGPHTVLVGFPQDVAAQKRLEAIAAKRGAGIVAPLPDAMLADEIHPNADGRAEMKRRLDAVVCGRGGHAG